MEDIDAIEEISNTTNVVNIATLIPRHLSVGVVHQ
jgi:hypothetical protein